jgi:hypothetical protein
LSGGVVSFTAAGTCLIDFNQAGNGSYNTASQKQQSITVSAAAKAAQSITVTSTAPTGATVGGASYTPTATASSGLGVAITLDSTSTGCSLSGGVVSFTAAGTCLIDFNQAGNGTYNPAPPKQQSITIAKAAQTITITSTAPTGATVGGASYTPTATASSGLAVAITIDSSSSSVCSISSGIVKFNAAGTCTIDANQAGNGSYNPAPQKQQLITVSGAAKTAQTISFTSTAPSSPAIGSTYTPIATASSGLAVAITIDSSSSSVCSISSGIVKFNAAGTCTIDANQAGNGSYNPAPQVQQKIAVAGASTPVQRLEALISQIGSSNIDFRLRATLTSLLGIVLRDLRFDPAAGTVNATLERGSPGRSWICAGRRGTLGDACWTLAEVSFVIALDQHSRQPQIRSGDASSWIAAIRGIETVLCGNSNWIWPWPPAWN